MTNIPNMARCLEDYVLNTLTYFITLPKFNVFTYNIAFLICFEVYGRVLTTTRNCLQSR
jgi:hypothetical protein